MYDILHNFALKTSLKLASLQFMKKSVQRNFSNITTVPKIALGDIVPNFTV